MNIFILDYDIDTCVTQHVDKHVVKMPTEYTQMLSTSVRVSGIDYGFKIAHLNHPCTKWARESLSNWLWLRDLTEALNAEWQHRYEHTHDHKSWTMAKSLPHPNIEDIGLTTFPQAMFDDVKHSDTVTAYRQFYNKYKRHLFAWKRREVPDWIEDYVPQC